MTDDQKITGTLGSLVKSIVNVSPLGFCMVSIMPAGL